MKTLKLLLIALTIATASITIAPPPAHAFTLFGIRFFEKPSPTPTPAPKATPTPSVTVTPTGSTQGVQTDGKLPSTGPEEGVATLLTVVVVGFVARKYWQVNHQI